MIYTVKKFHGLHEKGLNEYTVDAVDLEASSIDTFKTHNYLDMSSVQYIDITGTKSPGPAKSVPSKAFPVERAWVCLLLPFTFFMSG